MNLLWILLLLQLMIVNGLLCRFLRCKLSRGLVWAAYIFLVAAIVSRDLRVHRLIKQAVNPIIHKLSLSFGTVPSIVIMGYVVIF